MCIFGLFWDQLWSPLFVILFIYLFIYLFGCPAAYRVPRPGIRSGSDLSCSCNLSHSSGNWQGGTLNPLCWARDSTTSKTPPIPLHHSRNSPSFWDLMDPDYLGMMDRITGHWQMIHPVPLPSPEVGGWDRTESSDPLITWSVPLATTLHASRGAFQASFQKYKLMGD